jgi:hypothetical protein
MLIKWTPVVRLAAYHKGREMKTFRKQESIQLQGYDSSEGYVHSRSECVVTGADVR